MSPSGKKKDFNIISSTNVFFQKLLVFFFLIMEVMTPSLQSNLTSMKHIFFCLFVFKTGAKGRGPRCFLVLLFPCVSFPGAAERKIAHITVFSIEVGDYFWKHSQACRC